MGKFKEISGQKFGRLTVVSFSHRAIKAYWNVICECGNTKIISGDNLVSGRTKSCGCLAKEESSKRIKETCGKFGPESSHWKGGIYIHKGYTFVVMPYHPNANALGYIKRSRLVMESMLMRYLTQSEVVHHIDRNKMNDNEDNLMLFPSHSEHRVWETKQKHQL